MKFHITTYGCQMNVHDSETLAGLLVQAGHTPIDDIMQADVIVFNTCCIRENAENKLFGNVGLLKNYKKTHKNVKICLVGCATQQENFSKKLKEKFPFIDIILGTHNANELVKYLESGKKALQITENYSICENLPIMRDNSVCAFVNIMYGCNNFCSYCIVPYVRGRERSRKAENIYKEVENLVKNGYKEITLLGQNVNSYKDENVDFATLLQKLCKIEGKFRLRFMTSHPKDLSTEVISAIKNNSKLSKSIHLPVQAGSDHILQLMNRKYDRKKYFETVQNIRSQIEDCALTTDIMVGFPCETDQDFADTLDLVKKVGYDNAFMFVYSRREGTVADKMEGQISPEIQKKRITELVTLQNEISHQISQKYVGKRLEILCEGKLDGQENTYFGRSDTNKMANFTSNVDVCGQFVNIFVERANGTCLFGKMVD